MRYLTKTTLNASVESSEHVIIFIPQGELIETETVPASLKVRVTWRGQHLTAETQVVTVAAEPVK